MFIKNKAIRKLEAKRLYLNGYSFEEISERVGSSLAELNRWRSEEGWEQEKKTIEQGKAEHRSKTLAHIDMLLSSPLTTETLTETLLLASSLSASDIRRVSKKILKQLKGDSDE